VTSPVDPAPLVGRCGTCGGPLAEETGSCASCDAEKTTLGAADGVTRTVDGEPDGVPFTCPKRIAGYRILRELGAGGMGTVFEAYEETMNRKVALKVLSRHQAPSEKSARRFEHEAWIAGKLDHPNLVKVYERGTWEELSYYSMELLDGGSLHDVVQNMRRWGRDDAHKLEFGNQEYVRWAIGQIVVAARGLEYAHRHGVVHRDIKPMNLLLNSELGTLKIADFGLALDKDATRLTSAGKMLGTLAFMAPEQILGRREIDARCDIYALGVTLFELLTLQLPFSAKTQQMYISAVLTTEARRARKLNERVSRDLEVVIVKALEKEPRDRYPTMGAFADDLENVLHLRPIAARPPHWTARSWKWAQRKPVHAVLLATLVLGLPALGNLTTRTVQHRRLVEQTHVEELLRRARWLEERGRAGESMTVAGEVLELRPQSILALRHRAWGRFKLAFEQRDAAERTALGDAALDDLSRIVAVEPELSWPHALRAFMLGELGRPEQARAAADVAQRLRGQVLADDELELEAWLAMDRKDHGRAVDLYSELIRRRPDNAAAIGSRGVAYEALGDADAAIQEYRLAVGIDPGLSLTYIDLSRLSTMRGALEDGEQYVRRALELEPDEGTAHDVLAFNLLEQGVREASRGEREAARARFLEAERVARHSLELDPELMWAPVNVGRSLIERNRLLERSDPELIHQAVEQYERVLSRWPEPPSGEPYAVYLGALRNSCDARIELGDLQRAAQLCAQMIDTEPGNPDNHYNMAGVFAMLGRPDDAFAALKQDVELGDEDWQYLQQDRWFVSLRGDPRFSELIASMRR